MPKYIQTQKPKVIRSRRTIICTFVWLEVHKARTLCSIIMLLVLSQLYLIITNTNVVSVTLAWIIKRYLTISHRNSSYQLILCNSQPLSLSVNFLHSTLITLPYANSYVTNLLLPCAAWTGTHKLHTMIRGELGCRTWMLYVLSVSQ